MRAIKRLRYALLAGLLLFCAAVGVQAKKNERVGVAIDPFVQSFRDANSLCWGRFELVGFRPGSMGLGPAERGFEVSYSFFLEFSKSTTAKLYIYPKDLAQTLKTGKSCNANEELRKKAILAGDVSSAVILGTLTEKNGDVSGINIPKLTTRNGKQVSGFSVIMSHLIPASRVILGGTIEQSGSEIQIKNRDDDIEIIGNDLKGSVRIRSPAAKLVAPIGFESDQVAKQNLEFMLLPGQAAEVAISLFDSEATIKNGKFGSKRWTVDSGVQKSAWNLGDLRVHFSKIDADGVNLLFAEGRIRSDLTGLTLGSFQGSYMSSPQVETGPVESVTVKSAGAQGKSQNGIELKVESIAGLEAKSADLHIRGATIKLDGTGLISVISANTTNVSASFNLESASAGFDGDQTKFASMRNVIWSAERSPTTQTLSLNGLVDKLTVGKMILGLPGAKLNAKSRPDGDIDIQIVQTGNGGDFQMNTTNKTNFVARTNAVSMIGKLATQSGTFQFLPNGISLKIAGLIAQAGRIFGGIPQFAPPETTVINNTPVELSKAGSDGHLDFQSDTLQIDQPMFASSSPMQALAWSKNLTANGPAPLAAFLGTGDIIPIGGTLELNGFHLTWPQGIESVTFDFSGLSVETKGLSVGKIKITPKLDIAKKAAIADIEIDAVGIELGRIKHKANPKFSGKLIKPFTFETVGGTVSVGRDPLQLSGLAVSNASLHMKDIVYSSPDGIDVSSATAFIKLDSVSNDSANGVIQLRMAVINTSGATSGRATMDSFTLRFSGSKEKAAATGNLRVDNLDVVANSGAMIHEGCSIPVRISAQAGGADGTLAVGEGKLKFLVSLNDAQVQVFQEGALIGQCEWDQKVGELYSPSYYWCDGLFSNCGWRSNKIADISVRWQATVIGFQTSGQLTQIKLEPDSGKGAKLCEGHLSQLNLPIFEVFVITPTIPGGNIVAEGIRGYIAGVQAGWQTVAFFGITTLASFTSLTKVGNSFYLFGVCE